VNKTMTQLRLAAALCAGALQCLPALAARPLQTDDAGVIERGDCEVEAAWTRQRLAPGLRSNEASLQLGCGVGWGSQIDIGLASTRSAGTRETGLAVGGKTGLWRGAGEDGAALALGWEIVGSRASQGSLQHAATGLTLIGSLPLADTLTLHANLGHARDETDHRRSTTWGLALEHAGLGLAARWVPVAEVYGDDRERPWWNLGLRYSVVAEKLVIDMAYGRQFGSARPSTLTVGFTATF
jgi:hypothetical protein